jgi:putative exporter of polyketide antibiotics
MPGLSLGSAAGVRASVQSPAQDAGSVTAAAFGPGYTTTPRNGLGALTPTQPAGLALAISVAALVALVVIRHSLPR